MKSASLRVILVFCLISTGLPASAQTATQPDAGPPLVNPANPTYNETPTRTPPTGVVSDPLDTRAAEIRKDLTFLNRAPSYHQIPMEYRLAAIQGPNVKKIVEQYIDQGFSDYGTIVLSKKEQMPVKLRTEPGNTCSACSRERVNGKNVERYIVEWMRSLSLKQREELVTILSKA
ncbi:MAG: hypothetical protein H7Y22_05945 [Gemmatimonadaceae bacterium]|nr:hypothetical protein [Gloeobacterales cyanobacterium ES-bin-141]